MSWDAPPPGEPQQPTQPIQPYGQPTQPYGQPAQPYGEPTQPYGQPAQPYGQPGPNDQAPTQWIQPPPDQYGQPGQYGGPYAQPYPIYPAPPPQRSRTGFYAALGTIGVVVAAAVAIVVAVTSSKSGSGTPSALSSSTANKLSNTAPTDTTPTDAASSDDSSSGVGSDASQSPHNVIAPASAGPLTLLTNADTAQRIANIASSLSGNAAYGNPKIGFYAVGSDSSFSVWMLAESANDVPAFKASLDALGDTAMAREIAQGAKMTDVTTESPGPLGGALLCGKLTVSGSEFRTCEWVDDSGYGWVYFLPSVSNSDVLTYTLDLRGAAEQ